MAYTNSPLVSHTHLSPNNSGARTHSIDRITPHCVVGQCSAETIGNIFARASYQASSNYGIGYDGKVGLYVEEKNRSWCSSSYANDQRAVTIECASDSTHPYAFRTVVYEKLIELCVDICKRNGKTKLLWLEDKTKTLNYEPKEDEMVLTVHRWFANKSCIPVDSEVLTRTGWKSIRELQIGEQILTVKKNGLELEFDAVLDKVAPYLAKTVTCQNFTGTLDHRMLYWYKTSPDKIRIATYNELLEKRSHIARLPLAGEYHGKGLECSDALLKFLIATQADGHYMREENGTYYGLEFHLKKERKIDRIKSLLDELHLKYSCNEKSDGSYSVRIYNQNGINIVEDICEKYLSNKAFTWEWIELSPRQAKIFLSEILLWDGCVNANLYTSKLEKNIDIVQAISSLNKKACHTKNSNVCFRDSNCFSIDAWKAKTYQEEEVSCVTVPSGAFLCRQPNGYVFLIGNCPGDWMYSRMGDLAQKVTAKLSGEEEEEETTEIIYVVKAGDSLSAIASKYDTTYQKLAEYNGIKNPNVINVGQKIRIPQVVKPTPTPSETTEETVNIDLSVLRKGSKNTQVRALQTLLIYEGYSCGATGADGDFGARTYSAVVNFQRDKKIDVDGICGVQTWTKLLKG